MSRIKNFYHEEICREIQNNIIDVDYFYEKETRKVSSCCGEPLVEVGDGEVTDICSACREHTDVVTLQEFMDNLA